MRSGQTLFCMKHFSERLFCRSLALWWQSWFLWLSLSFWWLQLFSLLWLLFLGAFMLLLFLCWFVYATTPSIIRNLCKVNRFFKHFQRIYTKNRYFSENTRQPAEFFFLYLTKMSHSSGKMSHKSMAERWDF